MKNKKFMEAKVVMVGNVGVGKSSITVRYVLDKFDEKMQSTLGAAYMDKIHHPAQGKSIKFKIWDTAGQQKYKAIAKLYYKDCQIALMIFDVTNKQSFRDLKLWTEQLTKYAPKNVIFGVVANKIDLLHSLDSTLSDEQITRREEGQEFAKSINATYYEISARSKEGVDGLFQQIAEKTIAQIEKSTLSTKQESGSKISAKLSKNSFISNEQETKRRKKCCQS